MEFKGKIIEGKPVIEAVTETKENGDVVIHLPSLKLVDKFQQLNSQEGKNGERNIQ